MTAKELAIKIEEHRREDMRAGEFLSWLEGQLEAFAKENFEDGLLASYVGHVR